MKKALLALAVLLVTALCVVTVLDWGLPSPERLEAVWAAGNNLTYRVENGPLYSVIYGLDETGTLKSVYRESSVGGRSAITQLVWDETRLCFLRETPRDDGSTRWEVLALDENGRSAPLGGMMVQDYRAVSLSPPAYAAGVSRDGSGTSAIYDVISGTLVRLQSPPVNTAILTGVYAPKEDALTALLNTGRTIKLSRSGLTEVETVSAPAPALTAIRTPFALRLVCKFPLLLLTTALVLGLGLPTLFAVLLCVRAKRLAVRTAAVSAGSLFLALCLMSGLLLWQTTATRMSDRLVETRRISDSLAVTLSALLPSSILQESFNGSEYQVLYAGLFSNGADSDLFALRGDQLSMASSARHPYGAKPESVYDPRVSAMAQGAVSGTPQSDVLNLGGHLTAVHARPLLSGGQTVGVLVTSRASADILTSTLQTLRVLLLICFAVVLGTCCFLSFLLRRVTRPIGQLTRQMEAISDGDVKTRDDIRTGIDELGDMARAMQEMCMGLSIREYEVQNTIHSFARFVPRGLAQLLDRASVMEVSFGDVRSITGNVGILTVVNRDAARATLEDGPFVDFVNRAFSAVNRSVSERGGYLLSSGFDLGAVKVHHPGRGGAAVATGLDLLAELVNPGAPAGFRPNFFFMLHRAPFLYGIAGTKDEVFPFLSSQEMEFLGSFSAQFADAGVHIVLTDAFVKELESGYSTRYIGFVCAPVGGSTYKLYEVLDAYPDMERNLRIRYDGRFQEAIQLFYRGDYYLARSLFSTLLRACPGDGVARWYLFACEHFFNSGTQADNTVCQLFGIET